MVVQQHVLNWLYRVLTSVRTGRRATPPKAYPRLGTDPSPPQEYHDVNRTYNDVAQALSQYPSLLPRTDVHSTTHLQLSLLQAPADHINLDSISYWLLSPPPSPFRHHTSQLPGHDLSVSHIAMDSTRLPWRSPPRLCDPDGNHGRPPGPARRPSGTGLPSVSRGLG